MSPPRPRLPRSPGRRRAALAMLCLALAGCGEVAPSADGTGVGIVPGGNAGRGLALVNDYGCGTCHAIPGVVGARGRVGPPLDGWRNRKLVAGLLANTPEHLVAWLLDPPAIAPRTGMPAMGLDERQARDVAAYLMTLDGPEGRVTPPATGLNPSDAPRPIAIPVRGPFVGRPAP